MSEKDQVIQDLRATLISVKGAITIEQCNRDYKQLQGEWIPYKKLGYPTLDRLFLDVEGFKVTQANGQWYVDAIPKKETAHIASMVSKQKSSKKSAKPSYFNGFLKKQGSFRKPTHSSNYLTSSNYNSQYSNQYYRARSGPPCYNNVEYSYNTSKSYNYNKKPSEMKTITYPPKTIPKSTSENTKPMTENPDKTVNNMPTKTYPPKVLREVNTVVDEIKHSKKVEPVKLVEPKPVEKISASQRLSNLRDRLNTMESMNSIPLQLPAANHDHAPLPPVDDDSEQLTEHLEPSGPVAHVAVACSPEPPPESTTAVLKLEWTCRKLGLPQPLYKFHDLRPKRGPVLYDCSCKVGSSYSLSSYPDSSATKELAQEVAAAKVLALIESSEAGGLPTSSASSAQQGLASLVAEHPAGLWANIVPHYYREKYGENLPSNWQDLVENCPNIIKDSLVNGRVVLLPNNEEPRPCVEIPSLGEDTIDSDLPPLQFPNDVYWNVFVTVANSTLEIWLRIIGSQYSDLMETLLSDMASYYGRAGTLVDKAMIIKNAWYAVNLEDGGWQRAKVLEVDDEKATVFLGDHGDDDVVEFDKIKILEPQFRRLPAQAILCRLEGAEELSVSEEGAKLVRDSLPGRVLVAAPGPRADPADPSVALVLYDTTSANDINLNKDIVRDFCIAGDFTISQKLCKVVVGCVSEEGRVWVVSPGGAAAVRAALCLLTEGPYRRPLPAAPAAPPAAHPKPDPLYIVRTLAGEWVRCRMISGVDGSGTVRTQLVDSGQTLRAPLSSLVPLATFSPALAAYPPQAQLVRLGPAERVAAAMAGRLRQLLLEDARVVQCRALPPSPASPRHSAAGSGAAPNVELFVRSGPQNILACVNNDILMHYEYEQQQNKSKLEDTPERPNPVEALNRRKERIFRSAPSSSLVTESAALGGGGALPPPPLPAPGHCFDVYITMAANPWNFVVQPNNTRHQLQTMMASLQTECPKLSEQEAPSNPVSGELYTVYYDTYDSWYRVLIAGCVSSEKVSVYFCDYGDLSLFHNKELRPVPARVPLARSLPPQAIKAKLYDVWPLHQDWTVEDCIRFQELCVEQQFVGICKDMGKDPLNPGEPLLTLDLIDTSTDEDIYLNRQLVAEGRARLASTS